MSDEKARQMARSLLALRDDPDSRMRGLQLAFEDLMVASREREQRLSIRLQPTRVSLGDGKLGWSVQRFKPEFDVIIRVLMEDFMIDEDDICEVARAIRKEMDEEMEAEEAKWRAKFGDDDDGEEEAEVD